MYEDEYYSYDLDYELSDEELVQDIIDRYFGGIPKEEIIDILKEVYPENF